MKQNFMIVLYSLYRKIFSAIVTGLLCWRLFTFWIMSSVVDSHSLWVSCVPQVYGATYMSISRRKNVNLRKNHVLHNKKTRKWKLKIWARSNFWNSPLLTCEREMRHNLENINKFDSFKDMRQSSWHKRTDYRLYIWEFVCITLHTA